MARKKHNIHYLYKTTCNVTGRWYIGMHSTSNENDSYMGSGKRLRYSIRKYGVENHTKEILEYFDSRELLIEAEKKAITEDMINDNNCMNLRGGGEGGFSSDEHMKKAQQLGNKAALERMNNDPELKQRILGYLELGRKKLFEEGGYKRKGKGLGRIHTEETKQKMSESSKGMGKGETNSQYGTCWITKDGLNKKIKKEDLDIWLEKGWVKGRK